MVVIEKVLLEKWIIFEKVIELCKWIKILIEKGIKIAHLRKLRESFREITESLKLMLLLEHWIIIEIL